MLLPKPEVPVTEYHVPLDVPDLPPKSDSFAALKVPDLSPKALLLPTVPELPPKPNRGDGLAVPNLPDLPCKTVRSSFYRIAFETK